MVTKQSKDVRICEGCGEVLQFTDPRKPGYIPEEVYKRNTMNLCRRCFRMQHYSEDNTDFMPSDTLTKILYDAKRKKAVFAYVVDLFNLEATFNDSVNAAIKGSTVILLANKRDVLPKSFKDDDICNYIYKRAKEAGLIAKEVIIMSARKNYNIDQVRNAFNKYAYDKDIYVIGASSSGKSTFINKFIKNYVNITNRPITTSCYPGTTSRVISIPIGTRETIFDTPGIDVSHSMISIVEKDIIKLITPTKEIKPITFQMNKGNMFMIGNLARVELVDGPRTGFTIYCANGIDVHRGRIDKVTDLEKSLIAKKKIKPISETSGKLVARTINEINDTKQDIIISGLCWISYKGNKQKIKVYAPKIIDVSHRDAKF